MVTWNDPERPTGPVRDDGEKTGDVDAAPHGTNRATDRAADGNAELDTLEHDLRDFRR